MERKRVATEWDGCWFCDKCYSMHHWKTKAFIEDGQKLCADCYNEKENKRRKKFQKSIDIFPKVWYNSITKGKRGK